MKYQQQQQHQEKNMFFSDTTHLNPTFDVAATKDMIEGCVLVFQFTLY